uniref:hypothetical protein n=1 Tax=Pedobacter sp. TaxID=1411316 RepID=UPI003D7F40E3
YIGMSMVGRIANDEAETLIYVSLIDGRIEMFILLEQPNQKPANIIYAHPLIKNARKTSFQYPVLSCCKSN